MTAVKGSKQHRMVVVPYRPLYKAGVFLVFLAAMVTFSFVTYEYGMRQGLALKVAVVRERDQISVQLAEATRLIGEMRQEIADLKFGGEIDSRANEEVRQTVESLQDQIAQFQEEIKFYKGVMLPNAQEKGLRIERLDMVGTNVPNRYKYKLLLTQVVDKHEFVQGGVEIALLGRDGNTEAALSLSELNEAQTDAIGFRFRYFQNIDGELLVPSGFEPREVMIVARSSGKNGQRLEKKFNWQLSGG